MTPERIERKRSKDWQQPHNAEFVGRGTIWATPFKVSGQMIFGYTAGRNKLLGSYVCIESCPTNDEAKLRANELYKLWVDKKLDYLNLKPCVFTKEDVRLKLRGKHLICSCKDGEICHADVLIRIADN